MKNKRKGGICQQKWNQNMYGCEACTCCLDIFRSIGMQGLVLTSAIRIIFLLLILLLIE